MKTILLISAVAAFTQLAGCATQSNSAKVYRAGESQVEQSIRYGTVESVRAVTIVRDSKGAGIIAGGVVGGVAGSTVGEGKGSTIASVLGALGGAIAGQMIEEQANQRPGFEIVIKLDNGEKTVVVQEADEALKAGDAVQIVGYGSAIRVSKR
ncbi:MAG: glycine zipper 2TM domain-containing protein [Burkholderiaceae bacterium]